MYILITQLIILGNYEKLIELSIQYDTTELKSY